MLLGVCQSRSVGWVGPFNLQHACLCCTAVFAELIRTNEHTMISKINIVLDHTSSGGSGPSESTAFHSLAKPSLLLRAEEPPSTVLNTYHINHNHMNRSPVYK